MDLITYLAFDGQCETAFKHYEKVLRGKILIMMKGADMPAGTPMPPEAANRIMHARLQVGDRLLMGGDAPPGRHVKPQGFCANITLDDPAEAERIFGDLGEGGSVTMPIAETFWARKFGMLTDRFGVPWMINCEMPVAAPGPAVKPFVISRSFDAPREKLWACFTEPERVKQWWGPKGVKVRVSNIDLRPGGTHHYGMRMPDGKDIWGRQVYREIKAPERLVLINSFSDAKGGLARHPMGPTWPLELLSVFDFEAAGRGKTKTKLTVTWTPLNPTPEERTTFDAGHASMKGGWTGTLDQLAAYLAKA